MNESWGGNQERVHERSRDSYNYSRLEIDDGLKLDTFDLGYVA